ncbi:MAG TPA: polysaccharide biosynthesis C-terminal domain-containing protein, partial [Candidatus Paceibacterota bacterium]
WSSVGFFLGMAVSQYLMAEDLIKTIFWLNFLAMLINIFLNLIFIPAFGLLGAAWATSISYLTVPIIVFGYKIFKKFY